MSGSGIQFAVPVPEQIPDLPPATLPLDPGDLTVVSQGGIARYCPVTAFGTGGGSVSEVIIVGPGLIGMPTDTITTVGTISLETIAPGSFLANTSTITSTPSGVPMATLTAGTGLHYSSGGPYTPAVAGTIAFATIAAHDFLANNTGGTAVPVATPMATLTLGAGLTYTAGGPYTPAVDATLAATGVLALTAGTGIQITGITANETITNTGVIRFGGVNGTIVAGGGLVMNGNTVSVANALEFGTVAWGAGAVLANGTVVVTLRQSYAAHILGVAYKNGSGGGTTTLEARIDTTPVTGLTAVVIGSGTSAASGANAVAAGLHTIDLVFSGTTGTLSEGAAVTVYGTFD